MKKHVVVLIAVGVLVFACVQKTEESTAVGLSFEQVLEDYYNEGLALNPIEATYIGAQGYNHMFHDYLSSTYKSELKNYYTKYLSKLNEFNSNNLDKEQLISKNLIIRDCKLGLDKFNYYHDYFPLNQMFSLHLVMGQFASTKSAQPFKTIQDYEYWYSRVKGYLKWIESSHSKMSEGITKGYVHPKSIVAKMIPQFESLASKNIKEHLFYSPIKYFPDTLTVEFKNEFELKYTTLLKEQFIPTHAKMLKFLKTDYLSAARQTSGIGDLKGGKEWYNYQIRQFTATNMTAEEIHELGLSEVSRILGEMEKVKQQVGFEGSLKDFFEHVRTNKDLMPFTEPQQVIDMYNNIHETMKPHLANLFDKTPKTDFVVKRTEAFREKSASAQYNLGSLEEGRPGVFYVPIPNVEEFNIYNAEAVFLHEAIPGHHYQLSLAQENDELPLFRRTYGDNAYGEGWALYTEALGTELGLYTDPYQYFGMLSTEMHRAIRLVVDTGIHTKGWTREQAIEYSLNNEAMGEDIITREIERYMVGPGQALGYKIGQLKIMELRKKAEEKLSDKFDIKQFHNIVLESGTVTLEILEWKINDWIEEYKPELEIK